LEENATQLLLLRTPLSYACMRPNACDYSYYVQLLFPPMSYACMRPNACDYSYYVQLLFPPMSYAYMRALTCERLHASAYMRALTCERLHASAYMRALTCEYTATTCTYNLRLHATTARRLLATRLLCTSEASKLKSYYCYVHLSATLTCDYRTQIVSHKAVLEENS
jgi:hypothetical protein